MAMMRLDESSLETDEPYHIPGYCGYCPQFKYKIKETFGKTTHDLLTSPGISRSTKPVLAPLEGLREGLEKDQARKVKLINSRGQNLGDQKYGKKMVPGYTGYIPKTQHHFGDRYAIFSRNAISHMEEDHQSYNKQQNRLRKIIHSQGSESDTNQNTKNIKLPFKPLMEKTKMYFPKGIQHSLSPYTYANDDPRKYMMSGYTGFVPCSGDKIGKYKVVYKDCNEWDIQTLPTKRYAVLLTCLLKPQKKLPSYLKDQLLSAETQSRFIMRIPVWYPITPGMYQVKSFGMEEHSASAQQMWCPKMWCKTGVDF